MDLKPAIAHLESVTDRDVQRYATYMEHIRPHSTADVFRRWLFTYASVHTSWALNCRMYWLLRDLGWLGDKDELRRRIIQSRAGFQNKRTEYMWEFTRFFWDHPAWFAKSGHETWREYCARLRASAPGIGQAKGSFIVELMHPLRADVVCVDTHVLQLYGYTPKVINERGVRDKDMVAIEDHWTQEARKRNIPPVLGRWIFWDRKQGQPDSRYWSFVLEPTNFHETLTAAVGANDG
jgi:thermostable 8-oxoguanine DNA glycosylase